MILWTAVTLCAGGLFAIASTFDRNPEDSKTFFAISMLLFALSVIVLVVIGVKEMAEWVS